MQREQPLNRHAYLENRKNTGIDSMEIPAEWASRLVRESHGLHAVAHLKGVMPTPNEVFGAISDMFTRFTPKDLPRVRMWVDGGQRYTITDALIELASRSPLRLDERLALAAGTPEFCVTFNGLTAWCERFAERMQTQILGPLFRELNQPPSSGADFYAFFGKYGFTPFGVHDDTDHSLLWHLGPAAKTAYVWPRDAYISLTGGPMATLDYELLLHAALRFDLSPGDLLFIPSGDFHILETPEFSGTLGLTLFPSNPAQDCSDGLRLLAPNTPALDKFASKQLTLNELISLRRLALESNGYLITPPVLSTRPRNISDAVIDRRSILRTRPFWPLRHMLLCGREALLVRGRAILGTSAPLFANVCEAFDRSDVLAYHELEERIIGKTQSATLNSLVRKMNELSGVEIEIE